MIKCHAAALSWTARNGHRDPETMAIAQGIYAMHRRRVAPVIAMREHVAAVLRGGLATMNRTHLAFGYGGWEGSGDDVVLGRKDTGHEGPASPEQAAAVLIPLDWEPPEATP